MKRLIGTIFYALCLLYIMANPPGALGQYNGDNNKIGVHLISPTDEEIAEACRSLANANGGSGGKLTLTLVKGIDTGTLQRFHDIARNEQCMFIHPIKNSFDDPYWKPLDESTINYFVDLFKNIRPSTKYLYVVLGNEVNRGDEWGGECDPAGYAHIARSAAEKLKLNVPNIQIGLAGLDAYAPNGGFYCSRDYFLREVVKAEPSLINDYIDFQVVHEYPDADMTGSLRSLWKSEKAVLADLGVKKDLPVVISEIGWRRHRGLTDIVAAQRLYHAVERLNAEPQIWAITPFVYKYCGQPFDDFSLVNCDNNMPTTGFNFLADLPKVKGDPEHIYQAKVQTSLLNELIENTDYEFEIQVANQGTDIWRGINGDYSLKLFGPDVHSSFTSFYRVRPDGILRTTLRINPGILQGCPEFKAALLKGGRVVHELFTMQPCIVPQPTATMNISTFPGKKYDGVGELQVFNTLEEIIFRKQVPVTHGIADIGPITGVRFEDEYRIVWLSPGSLPVQIVEARFHKGNNEFTPPLLLPLDSDKDGALSLSDIIAGFR